MKKFLKKIIIYLLIVTSLVSAVDLLYLYRRNQCFDTMGTERNNNAVISNVPQNIQICNFGNSHGYCGLDYEDYTDTNQCFNFALPSQSLAYDYDILQNYRDSIAPGAVIFISFSYNSIYGADETESDDFESKNQRYYRFLEPQYIRQYDRTTDFYVNYAPILNLNIVKIAKEILGRNNIDFWNRTTNQEEASASAYSRYQKHVANAVDSEGNRIINQVNVTALYNMISLCRELGARPVLITVPYLREYYECIEENDSEFFDDFYSFIDELIIETGIEYFDYSRDERFSDSYDLFLNLDHLNHSGAREFTGILIEDVI